MSAHLRPRVAATISASLMLAAAMESLGKSARGATEAAERFRAAVPASERIPVAYNAERRAKRASGLSGRQWRKLRKAMRRAGRQGRAS